MQLDLSSFGGEENDENSDFYNPENIQEGTPSRSSSSGSISSCLAFCYAAVAVVLTLATHLLLTSPSGDTVEVIKDSVFYSIPKTPKEGVHTKGRWYTLS